MILEVKNEIDAKGAKPYCQGILYYTSGHKDEMYKAYHKNMFFNFPCLIVTLFGKVYHKSVLLH